MKEIRCFLVLSLLFASVASAPATSTQARAAARKLVKRFFDAIVKKGWATVEAQVSDRFQSAHDDGARTKAEEMKLVRGLDLRKYAISRLTVTSSGDTMIVTYMLQGDETIDGKRLHGKPAERMSIFQKMGKEWRMIAHANFRAL